MLTTLDCVTDGVIDSQQDPHHPHKSSARRIFSRPDGTASRGPSAAGGLRRWASRSPRFSPLGWPSRPARGRGLDFDHVDAPAGDAARRPRQADRRPARVRHGSLQLPLPVLHAGRGPSLARPRRDPHLRGDRAPRRAVRIDGRRRRAPDRRRAPGAPGVPEAGRAPRPHRGPARPVADHQRLPARGHGRRPRRGRSAAGQRVARLALAGPLLPDHPARLAAAGDARPRGARAPSRGEAHQGQLRGDARLHRGRGAALRRAGTPQALPGALHRVHAARRRPRLVRGPCPDRRRDPRDDRRGPPARAAAARAALDRPRLPLRRRPRRDRLHQPGVGAVLRGLQPHPADRRGQAAHLPVQPARDRPARTPRATARRRRARASDPRRGLAQGAQAPRLRARLPPAAAHDEPDRRLR